MERSSTIDDAVLRSNELADEFKVLFAENNKEGRKMTKIRVYRKFFEK